MVDGENALNEDRVEIEKDPPMSHFSLSEILHKEVA